MATTHTTRALVIGAGPFGLALAAALQERGVEHLVAGEPMAFWRRNMPAGMLLRSGPDWHLDVACRDTLEAYLAAMGRSDETPIARDTYLGYVDWLAERKGIAPLPLQIERLEHTDDGFVATAADGSTVEAKEVVVAIGLGFFAHIPSEFATLVPAGRFSHTHETVDFTPFAGRRVLIVGGRQSAFEWAALLHEAGADAVHVVHRHDTPTFAASDWTWVDPLVDRTAAEPGWFARAEPGEREAIVKRMWGEGRLKLEPWLAPRVQQPGITVWPRASPAAAELTAGGLAVALDTGAVVEVDHVLFATGYRVDLARVPFLRSGGLDARIAHADGFPVLDATFQSSVAGLFFTSMMAARDFGPFMGFTVSARAAASVIAEAIASREQGDGRSPASATLTP